jgi:hypothetical protein
MSDKPTIYITSVTEPSWVYGPGDVIRFAVHLAFDLTSVQQDDAAETEIKALLDKAKAWSYSLYVIDGPKATKVNDIELTPITEHADSSELVAWLKDRNALKKSALEDQSEVEVELLSANACELLLGSIAWDAPIPHRAGLLRVVQFQKPEANEKGYVIMPSAANEYSIKADHGNESDEVVIDEGFEATLITSKLSFDFKEPLNIGLPSIDGGFFKRSFSEEDYRFLRSFEAIASSIFWSLPAFLELEDEVVRIPTAEPWQIAKLGGLMAIEPLLIALRPLKLKGALATNFNEVDRFGELLLPLSSHREVIEAIITKFQFTDDDIFRIVFKPPGGVPNGEIEKVEGVLGKLLSWETLVSACNERNKNTPPDSSLVESSNRVAFRCLRGLMSMLQEEQGVERLLKLLLEEKKVFDDTFSKNEYEALLADNFNGLNAVRNECGARYLEKLLVASRTPTDRWVDHAKKQIGEINESYNITIEDKTWNGVFGDGKANDGKGKVKRAIERTIEKTFEGYADVRSTVRFVPDSVPQPVPIAISKIPTGSGVDWFTSNLNGVGVLIGNDNKWAHANLVEAATTKNPSRIFKPILKPFLPISIDNRREMFLQYRGFPFMTPAYSDLSSDGDSGKPFYSVQDLKGIGTQRMPPKVAYGKTYKSAVFCVSKSGSLPKLLQKGSSDAKPWEIGDTDGPASIDLSGLSDDIFSETKVLRRTMIGSTAFGASRDRLGEEYTDVFPLARDYPRRVLACSESAAQILDLFRFAKGDGMLSLSNGEELEISLDQFRVAGKRDAKMSVLLLSKPNSDLDSTDNTVEVPLSGIERLQIRVKPNEAVVHDDKEVTGGVKLVDFKMDKATAFWIRLKLSSTQTSISFAQEKIIKGAAPQLSSDDQVPIVLIGKPNSWKESFKESNSSCTLSRVTWMDWEQWVNNPDLLVHGRNRDVMKLKDWASFFLTASLLRSEDPTGEMSALLDRLPDPAVSKFIVEVAYSDDLLDKLQLLGPQWLTVGVPEWWKLEIPSLQTNPSPGQVADWFSNCLDTLKKIDSMYRLKSVIGVGEAVIPTEKDGGVQVLVPEGYVAKLSVRPVVKSNLFAAEGPFDERLKQFATGTFNEGSDDYFIFDGAKMLIESMYAKEFDPAEYARVSGSLGVFAHGSSRSYAIKVKGQEHQDQKLKLQKLKLFASVDISTQRWRHSGRPIYHWISPRKQTKNNIANNVPVIELSEMQPVIEFEQGLFFEREDIDCDTLRCRLLGDGVELQAFSWDSPSATYYRHGFRIISRYLGALAENSVRKLGSWERKANPWQVRCAILADSSRIEITRPQVRCLIPMTQDVDAADVKVISPAYPQLSDLAPTPAIAAILEERPFSVGGLADRIVAEIATGPGFGFEKTSRPGAGVATDSEGPVVQPLDFGKETSRDGRLDSRSWSFDRLDGSQSSEPKLVANSSHQFVIDVEGPVGLHFDQPTAPSPAWSNSQYLLKPRSLNDKVLPEESFVGVRMRRILDPEWVIANTVGSDSPTDSKGQRPWPINNSCLIRPELDQTNKFVISLKANDETEMELLELRQVNVGEKNAVMVVEFNRELLGRNYTKGKLVLAVIPSEKKEELCFLHSSAGSGRFNLSVAVVPQKSMLGDKMEGYEGIHNGANLIASTEWSVADKSETQNTSFEHLVLPSDSKLTSLTSSSITFKEWTRTARNAGWLYSFDSNNDGVKPIEAPKIRFATSKKRVGTAAPPESSVVEQEEIGENAHVTKETWIVPSTFRSKQPLYVQRHLVGVFSSLSGGSGRQFDIYAGTQFLKGKNWKLGPELAMRNKMSLEIFELEVPAKPLCSIEAETIASELRVAKFDLKKTGGELLTTQTKLYQLHLRLINSPSQSDSTWTIQVGVPEKMTTSGGGETEPRPSLSVRLFGLSITHKSPQKLLAIDIVFKAEFGRTISDPRAYFHMSDGNIHANTEVDGPVSAKFDIKKDQIEKISEMAVLLNQPSAEMWADVSLLHREPTVDFAPSLEAFDFDWLFSSTSRAEIQPTERSKPERLHAVTEAQARFITSARKQFVITKNVTP